MLIPDKMMQNGLKSHYVTMSFSLTQEKCDPLGTWPTPGASQIQIHPPVDMVIESHP